MKVNAINYVSYVMPLNNNFILKQNKISSVQKEYSANSLDVLSNYNKTNISFKGGTTVAPLKNRTAIAPEIAELFTEDDIQIIHLMSKKIEFCASSPVDTSDLPELTKETEAKIEEYKGVLEKLNIPFKIEDGYLVLSWNILSNREKLENKEISFIDLLKHTKKLTHEFDLDEEIKRLEAKRVTKKEKPTVAEPKKEIPIVTEPKKDTSVSTKIKEYMQSLKKSRTSIEKTKLPELTKEDKAKIKYYRQILKDIGIRTRIDKDNGYMILDLKNSKFDNSMLWRYNVSINDLLRYITTINGDICIEYNVKLTSLENVQEINGTLSIAACPKLTNLNSLKKVTGNIAITECGNLNSIPGTLDIGGCLEIRNCKQPIDIDSALKVNEIISYNSNVKDDNLIWLGVLTVGNGDKEMRYTTSADIDYKSKTTEEQMNKTKENIKKICSIPLIYFCDLNKICYDYIKYNAKDKNIEYGKRIDDFYYKDRDIDLSGLDDSKVDDIINNFRAEITNISRIKKGKRKINLGF